VASLAELGEAWRALEAEAAGLSFFQSWTWVGCLAEERFDAPILLRAEVDGRVVGLALFNRRAGRLHLAESGAAELDAPFTEHNAPLIAAGHEATALPAIMQAAWRVPGVRRLVLSGVGTPVLAAAGGIAYRRHEQPAPWIDLAAIRASGQDWLTTLSANTRYQLRRSARCYATRGELELRRAGSVAEALAWFDALVELHGESWRQRGHPGAFANPFSRRFHRTLIERAQPRGELDLLRVTAGEAVLGYLYNFRLGGRVYAYQSGLDHSGAGRHGKPGLTCHAMAVERALAEGDPAYDFLAGGARYKLSLSNAAVPLLWVELVSAWSIPGVVAQARQATRRLAGRPA
jgi:CelD/BcsL family acetyltransferase involved in cellulose biosynthesis